MNTADPAEEIVKISLDGVETAFKIAGAGAKNIAAIIIAKLNEEKQTKGKLRLTNMMKSGKALDIFTIKSEDLKTFCEQAKKYGVRYCSLARKKDDIIDGMVDLMVYEEDSPKIARIVERFKIGPDIQAKVQQQLEKEKVEIKEKNEHEKFIDEIMPIEENEVQKREEIPSHTENTGEKNQSEISLNGKQKNNQTFNENEDKPSVIEELKEIQNEMKEKEGQDVTDISNKENKANIYKKEKNDKKNYTKSKYKKMGKRFRKPKHFNQRRNGR